MYAFRADHLGLDNQLVCSSLGSLFLNPTADLSCLWCLQSCGLPLPHALSQGNSPLLSYVWMLLLVLQQKGGNGPFWYNFENRTIQDRQVLMSGHFPRRAAPYIPAAQGASGVCSFLTPHCPTWSKAGSQHSPAQRSHASHPSCLSSLNTSVEQQISLSAGRRCPRESRGETDASLHVRA